MDTATLRQQLHEYLEVAEDKKINAIYTMVEDEIKGIIVEYSPEFKDELDKRVTHYLEGGKMISPTTMNKRLQATITSNKEI